jgi:hypothetical protein
VVSLGIRALKRRTDGKETPSNHFLARWGSGFGDDRKVHLHTSEMKMLLSDLTLPSEGLPIGPVALVSDGMVLGRGIVGRDGLRHEIPRASAERLKLLLATPAAALGSGVKLPQDK